MKSDWKLTVIVFTIGVILGTSLTSRCASLGAHGWGEKDPAKFHRQMMSQFTSKLKLTPDQQEKVSAILENTRAKISALREEIHPKFEEIRNSSKVEIRKLLTPDQQAKFDVMSAQMEARFEKRHAVRNTPGKKS